MNKILRLVISGVLCWTAAPVLAQEETPIRNALVTLAEEQLGLLVGSCTSRADLRVAQIATRRQDSRQRRNRIQEFEFQYAELTYIDEQLRAELAGAGDVSLDIVRDESSADFFLSVYDDATGEGPAIGTLPLPATGELRRQVPLRIGRSSAVLARSCQNIFEANVGLSGSLSNRLIVQLDGSGRYEGVYRTEAEGDLYLYHGRLLHPFIAHFDAALGRDSDVTLNPAEARWLIWSWYRENPARIGQANFIYLIVDGIATRRTLSSRSTRSLNAQGELGAQVFGIEINAGVSPNMVVAGTLNTEAFVLGIKLDSNGARPERVRLPSLDILRSRLAEGTRVEPLEGTSGFEIVRGSAGNLKVAYLRLPDIPRIACESRYFGAQAIIGDMLIDADVTAGFENEICEARIDYELAGDTAVGTEVQLSLHAEITDHEPVVVEVLSGIVTELVQPRLRALRPAGIPFSGGYAPQDPDGFDYEVIWQTTLRYTAGQVAVRSIREVEFESTCDAELFGNSFIIKTTPEEIEELGLNADRSIDIAISRYVSFNDPTELPAESQSFRTTCRGTITLAVTFADGTQMDIESSSFVLRIPEQVFLPENARQN